MKVSSTRKPHRRAMSISSGSNDSSENLLSVPNQRIINNTSSISNNYNSSQNSSYLDSGKSYLSPINEVGNKSSQSQPPSTPSKNKSFGRQMSMSMDSSSRFELKNIFATLVFFCALVFFLGSLSGIGPPFDELDYVVKEPAQIKVEDIVQDSNPIVNNGQIDDNEEPFVETTPEKIGEQNELDGNVNLDTSFVNGENRVEENQVDNIINDIKPEDVKLSEEVTKQKQEESILEDVKIESNPITNNMNESEHTNFGHSDEILISNVESKSKSEEPSNNFLDNETLNLIGLSNRLNKNKLRRYKLDLSELDGNIINNYVNYTYQASKPHFTYEDVLGSLTEKEREEVATIQSIEMNTDESLDSSCGTWQNSYSKLHGDILAGKAEQRYVAYVCEGNSNCGNLGDRILGMTSTFLFALLTNRAYVADWQAPLPLDTIFDSPNIDWSYDSLDPESAIKDLTISEINVIDFDAKSIDNQFLLSNWTSKYPDSFIKFYTNRGMIIRTFDSKYYSQTLKELGLRPYTAFGCIFDYLFRPVPSAMSFITKYTSLFSLNNIFSVGIQIRAREDTDALQDYQHFFNCADQLTQTYAVPDQKVIYFLITDSVALRNEAVQKLEHVIISGLPIESHHGYRDHADDVNNAIIENWILSKTDYRVISPGGYGKLSAFHSKQLHTTVSMNYPVFDKQIPDCSKEDAFITFSKLASEWSLG